MSTGYCHAGRSPRPEPMGAQPTVSSIIKAAAVRFDVTIEDLTGPLRSVPLVKYRQATMAAIRELTTVSYPTIARAFNKDHTTVIHACRVAADSPLLAELLQTWGRGNTT